ncbi:MAG: hypothetical protein PHV34_05920 [Verrucomicrobiae bacterium]|nr:hypothetical protein [Verrucomicrobiae bacterium]
MKTAIQSVLLLFILVLIAWLEFRAYFQRFPQADAWTFIFQ